MAEQAVFSLFGKVVDSLFRKSKEEISYMWNCSKNVKELKEENEKLTQMRERVLQQKRAAEGKGDTLKDGVQQWVEKAESHILEAKDVVAGFEADDANKTCFNLGMCIDLGTRYRYGKKAANEASSLLKDKDEGKTFESGVSVSTPIPGVLGSYVSKNIDGLDTHKSCIEKIMKYIEGDNMQIIGIYGTGGVGKTTLAMEVAVKVKSLNSFAAVEFITVSQPVDAERIKKEVETAAKRINNREKVLVILDDVWEKLKLDEVGIPCGDKYKNCKILLTSRSKDVCETMNATGLISVDSLPMEEAWILFKRVVGDKLDENLNEIAEKIVDGCGGLPLIIQVVGAALKNESIESWKRALTQLQKRTTLHIDPMIRLAYSHLQLSYDFLESEEAKLCFLLCSMYPEDYDVPLEHLAYYGVGLEIFEDLDSMEDARNRVQDAVKILKSTCLLLDGDEESTVKMHDVVREVALLIASKGSNKFLVKAGIGLTEWQPRTKRVKSCTGISLMRNRISKLPDYKLEIPHLDIFLIQGNYLSTIPDTFILGMEEARVLDFGYNKIESLPRTLKQLTNLSMLNLGGNEYLLDISTLGHLKSLEILILSNTGIVEIPQEIGYLVNLRRLEVKGCLDLSHIEPGVMSKLRWLEELHIGYYPDEDGNYKGFMEIGELSMLTFLDLFVPHVHLIPTEGVCFTKLKGFVIQIGGRRQMYDDVEVVHKKTLLLTMKDLDTSSMLQVKELIKLSDGIIFDSVDNLANIGHTMGCESLDDLTAIMLSKCNNLLRLVDSDDWDVDEELGGENTKKQFFSKLEHLFLAGLNKLHDLWNCPDQYISLKNIVTLHISGCHKLVRLFSVNVARGLVSLKTLTIGECSSLEEVIWDGDESDDTDIVFRRLAKIELCKLKELKSFYAGKVNIKFPSLEMVEIYKCDELERLFSVNAARGLVNLKTLTIQKCKSLKEVIWDGDGGNGIDMVVFPLLVKIELRFLENVKSFYAGKVIIRFPSLEFVEIYECYIMDEWRHNGTYDTPNLKRVNQEGGNEQRRMVKEYKDEFKQVVGLREWPILK